MPLNTSDLDSIWPVLVRARERRAIGPERAAKLSERERSGERTKLAVQISLKGDVGLIKLRKSVFYNDKNKLSTGILLPLSIRR